MRAKYSSSDSLLWSVIRGMAETGGSNITAAHDQRVGGNYVPLHR